MKNLVNNALQGFSIVDNLYLFDVTNPQNVEFLYKSKQPEEIPITFESLITSSGVNLEPANPCNEYYPLPLRAKIIEVVGRKWCFVLETTTRQNYLQTWLLSLVSVFLLVNK